MRVIAAMAQASLANGAIGVRLERPGTSEAVRRRCPASPDHRTVKRSFAIVSVTFTAGMGGHQGRLGRRRRCGRHDAPTASDRRAAGAEPALIDRPTQLGATLMAMSTAWPTAEGGALGLRLVGTTLYVLHAGRRLRLLASSLGSAGAPACRLARKGRF